MPAAWTAVPMRRPYRVMVLGCATTGFFGASEEEKETRFFPRFKQVLAEWEELGARVIASFCDDVFQVGSNREPLGVEFHLRGGRARRGRGDGAGGARGRRRRPARHLRRARGAYRAPVLRPRGVTRPTLGVPDDLPNDRAHHRRRLSGRDPDEAHRTATPLELLYDLTFVVAFGIAANELAHYVAEGHVWTGIAGFAFASFAVAWAWINYSWFASAYDTDDWVLRLATMVQMVGVIVLALGLEQVFASIDAGDALDNGVMVAGYVVMRVPMVFLWARAARARSGPPPGGGDLHLDDLGRAGLLGRARDRRSADRDDVRVRARAHRGRDGRPADRAVPKGRDALACRPHRGALRPARDHHAGRGDHRHRRVDQRGRARPSGWTVDAAVVAFAGVGLTFAAWWTYFAIPWAEVLGYTASAGLSWATATS